MHLLRVMGHADESSFYDELETSDHELSTSQNSAESLDLTVLDGDSEETIPPDPGPGAPSTQRGPESGRYELERRLGQGTFGCVYAARDTKLGRLVALKVLHAEHAANVDSRQRFLQEAGAAACIAHPGIVTVFDVGTLDDADTPYIAMELLDGESLQARLARCGRMSSAKVRQVGSQIASAIDAAHRAGVLHRDLKPANLFIVPDPAAVDGERVKVLDFGLAKPTLTASVKTRAATVFGTPNYMSPEQFEAKPNVDPRSDIYALGCILYELGTGRIPFAGSLREVVTKHRSEPPPSMRELAPEICPELDALVRCMLAKDPKARPQTMAHVGQALRADGQLERKRDVGSGLDETAISAASPGVPETVPPTTGPITLLPFAVSRAT